jgi:transposase
MNKRIIGDKQVIGIDVSKEWLDIAAAGERAVTRIDNTPQALADWLGRARPALVAFEPTGGYERSLRDALRQDGIPFRRVHPNQVVAFRHSRAVKAKTDPIDARLIADFAAQDLTRRGRQVTIVGDDDLREMAARRSQLVAALQAERCRLDTARATAVRASLARLIDILAADLDALEAEIAAHVAANPHHAERAALLQSLRGVGPVTAMVLIADLPELGLLSGKQIAALVGLAPYTHDSGKRKGRARTGHGRVHVRRALFNAARAAIRHPSPLQDFYLRLVHQNGRPGKVALTALMRKMLVTLNAIARDQQPWKLANTS